jgi:hypothetical protein
MSASAAIPQGERIRLSRYVRNDKLDVLSRSEAAK